MTPGLTKLHVRSLSLTVLTNESLPTSKPLGQGLRLAATAAGDSLVVTPQGSYFLGLNPKAANHWCSNSFAEHVPLCSFE